MSRRRSRRIFGQRYLAELWGKPQTQVHRTLRLLIPSKDLPGVAHLFVRIPPEDRQWTLRRGRAPGWTRSRKADRITMSRDHV